MDTTATKADTGKGPSKVISCMWFGMEAQADVYEDKLHVRAHDKAGKLWQADILLGSLDDGERRKVERAQALR